MTLARLLPPFFTGQVLDQVIQPFQKGALPLAQAWPLALTLLGGLTATLILQECAACVPPANDGGLGRTRCPRFADPNV
jgi:hypothetical protein